MDVFDPVSAIIGGSLIGTASVLLMLLNGRIAGASRSYSPGWGLRLSGIAQGIELA